MTTPDHTPHDCHYCDTPGGEKTCKHQVCLPLNGKVQCLDRCIHHIVAALNAGGVQTKGSCCGHQEIPGHIMLSDGRWLTITKTEPSWVSEVKPSWTRASASNENDTQGSNDNSHLP